MHSARCEPCGFRFSCSPHSQPLFEVAGVRKSSRSSGKVRLSLVLPNTPRYRRASVQFMTKNAFLKPSACRQSFLSNSECKMRQLDVSGVWILNAYRGTGYVRPSSFTHVCSSETLRGRKKSERCTRNHTIEPQRADRALKARSCGALCCWDSLSGYISVGNGMQI